MTEFHDTGIMTSDGKPIMIKQTVMGELGLVAILDADKKPTGNYQTKRFIANNVYWRKEDTSKLVAKLNEFM